MDISYQNVDRIPDPLVLKSQSINPAGYCLIALGTITLIGSLVAAGYFYPQLGYTSLAIGGAGVIFGILSFLLGKYGCITTITVTEPEETTETPQPQIDITLKEDIIDAPPRTEPTSPKIEIPDLGLDLDLDLPPLPHIFDLKLDVSDPLSKALPETEFLNQNQQKTILLFATKGLFTGAELEKQFQNIAPDNELLDIPLSFWINQDPNEYDFKKYALVMRDPERKPQVEAINKRIAALDQAIQVKERLKRLNYSFSLKVKDLLPAWSDSPLKLMLAMDNELSSLTTSSLAQLGGDTTKCSELRSRILPLSREKTDYALPESFTKESIDKILLVDLPKLKAQHIHASPSNFPPITFLLIDFSELQQINTHQLNSDQLHLIFSSTYLNKYALGYYVHLLKSNQINSCISLIKNKKLFENLSEEQASQLDVSQIDQEIFSIVFKCFHPTSEKLLRAIKPEKVFEITKFFGTKCWYWETLDDPQILALDYSKIDQPAFSAMFRLFSTRAEKLLQALKLERVYEISEFFGTNYWYWEALDDPQILALDYSKIDQPAFSAMFKLYSTRAEKLLQALKLERVYEISEFFGTNYWYWKALDDPQILALDYSKIDRAIFNALFYTYDSRTERLLSKISNTKLLSIKHFIGPELKKKLSSAQQKLLE